MTAPSAVRMCPYTIRRWGSAAALFPLQAANTPSTTAKVSGPDMRTMPMAAGARAVAMAAMVSVMAFMLLNITGENSCGIFLPKRSAKSIIAY